MNLPETRHEEATLEYLQYLLDDPNDWPSEDTEVYIRYARVCVRMYPHLMRIQMAMNKTLESMTQALQEYADRVINPEEDEG